MMNAGPAARYLHSWNAHDGLPWAHVRLEDDVREALQNVRARHPTLAERKRMLELSSEIGIQVTFLGFPAASTTERDRCANLVRHITARSLPLEPVLMARASAADLRPILEIQQTAGVAVTLDLYICSSPIRAAVEGWSLSTMLERLEQVARLALDEGLNVRIAFEDSTRTPADDLTLCVRTAVDLGVRCLVLNDTVGDCTPAGARAHTRFVADLIDGADVELSWHGHNDKGLALANSLAAIDAGARLISGTFTGLGERTGNLALEQLIVMLAEQGDDRYDLSRLGAMCEVMAKSTGVEVPDRLPVVGADAFSTSTGTHATAMMKARRLGVDFEDAVFSSVPAARLGRRSKLLVGPNSGRAAVIAALTESSLPSSDRDVDALLTFCKSHDRTLHTSDELLQAIR